MADRRQLSFIPKPRHQREHGGSLAVGKRRSARPLNLKLSHHLTLKSSHALGARSLFRHKKMILGLIRKNSQKFHVKVYESAIQGNHMHLLVKAQSREGLQNFFRVIAGHVAQRILEACPLSSPERGGAPPAGNRTSRSNRAIVAAAGTQPGAAPACEKKEGCKKNQRRFWSFLLYSRVVSWGREFQMVKTYIQKNTLELLRLVAYTPRSNRKALNSS